MKMKFLILSLLFTSISFSQNQCSVKFKILYEKNTPAPAVNIVVLDSRPINGTQTDLNGNAELLGISENDKVEISYLGPTTPNLRLTNSVDSIVVNLEAKKATYYFQKKKIKTVKFKDGY